MPFTVQRKNRLDRERNRINNQRVHLGTGIQQCVEKAGDWIARPVEYSGPKRPRKMG